MMLKFAKPIVAIVLLLTGLYLVVFGNAWAPFAFELLEGSEAGAWLELLVPFLPMLIIASGAALFASRRR